MNIDYKKEIIDFIIKNGWEKYEENEDYICFGKNNNIGIDISDDEIVLIGAVGDFLHFEINKMSCFALLGYLVQYKYIAIDYKF